MWTLYIFPNIYSILFFLIIFLRQFMDEFEYIFREYLLCYLLHFESSPYDICSRCELPYLALLSTLSVRVCMAYNSYSNYGNPQKKYLPSWNAPSMQPHTRGAYVLRNYLHRGSVRRIHASRLLATLAAPWARGHAIQFNGMEMG